MRKFAIYYNNGDVVYGGGEDDEEITLTFSKKWLEAPSDGVCYIVSEIPSEGRITLRDYEYYYQLPYDGHGEGDIGASMKIGAYLRQLCDLGGIVKFGGWTSNKTFKKIAQKANQDEYVPKIPGTNYREQKEDSSDD